MGLGGWVADTWRQTQSSVLDVSVVGVLEVCQLCFHTVGSGHRICAGGQWHSLSHAPIPGPLVSSVDEVPGCCAGAGFSWTE